MQRKLYQQKDKKMGEISDVVLPVVQQPLTDIWDATVGSWIGFWADKKRLDRQLKFEDYKNKILTECGKIPEDKKLEPQLSIIGPALEASKFYIDEEILRDMFAKLIANSMNADKQQFINAAFVEIIKQMSPVDANILKTFIKNKQQPISRFIEYREIPGQGIQKDQYFPLVDLVYTIPEIDSINNANLIANGISINNLSRLGLLDCTLFGLGECLAEDNMYALHQQIMNDKIKIQHLNVDMIKGLVKITPLGTAFINSCME